jgi:hypothetical protein
MQLALCVNFLINNIYFNLIKAPYKLNTNLSEPGYNKKSHVELKEWEDGNKNEVPGRTHTAYFPTEHT